MKVAGNIFLRAAAFVTACVILAVTAAMAVRYRNDYDERTNDFNIYECENEYSMTSNELFVKLWTVANMYLRNLDDEGKFTGSKYFKNGTEEAMKKLGLMDKDGNITIGDYKDFEYIVDYNGNTLSNTKRASTDFSDDYSIIQTNDNLRYPKKLVVHYGYEMSWYTTDYGMTYYNLSHQITDKSIAIFDFDTKGLPSYYDEKGAKIYYREDGSTPVPEHGSDNNSDVRYYESDTGDSDNHYVIQNGKKYEYFAGSDRPICIYIKPTDSVITQLEKNYAEFEAVEKEFSNKMTNLIPLGVIALVLGVLAVIFGGYDTKEKKFVLKVPNNFYTELYLLLAITASVGAVAFASYYDEFKTIFEENITSMCLCYAFVYAALYAAGLFAVNALFVQIKCRSLLSSSLIGSIIIKTVNAFKDIISKQMLCSNAMTRRFVIRTIAAVLAEIFIIFLFGGFVHTIILFIFFSLVNLAAYMMLSIRDFEDINKLGEHISAMQKGDYTKVKTDETSVTYGMTKNLNEISCGMQTAVEKRVQSERMKIDLVTNVSHDLKTPLTSIISYIYLLGSEEMSPEARDYVKILEDKSARLKAIVSDLFDLAKATSGTDVAKDKLDIAILVQQVVGDMGDKIEKYGKDVRTEIKTDSAPVIGDGKKLYRVIQNLIDNSLKYSLDGTRIYVTVDKEKADAVITVKNISAEEMNFTAEEITERFARGDSSRTTEGSGLGLSIAKSFTEANGGEFRVLIDGDMFTAEVRLPIIE